MVFVNFIASSASEALLVPLIGQNHTDSVKLYMVSQFIVLVSYIALKIIRTQCVETMQDRCCMSTVQVSIDNNIHVTIGHHNMSILTVVLWFSFLIFYSSHLPSPHLIHGLQTPVRAMWNVIPEDFQWKAFLILIIVSAILLKLAKYMSRYVCILSHRQFPSVTSEGKKSLFKDKSLLSSLQLINNLHGFQTST